MKNTGNDRIRIVTLLSDSITKSEINFNDIMFENDKSNYDIYKVFNIFLPNWMSFVVFHSFISFYFLRSIFIIRFSPFSQAYGQSKLALWMFHEEILRRYSNVESFVVNPG